MKPRYKLRTLLILLAVLPPLSWIGWTKYEAWKAEQERRAAIERERQAASVRIRRGQLLIEIESLIEIETRLSQAAP
jgi:hypothetical protein